MPADAPHAYLSGDLVECMARSNNVLNTGFWPQVDRDNVALFSAALTFSPHSEQEVLLPAVSTEKGKKGRTATYAPPISEFDMLRTRLGKGQDEVFAALGGPAMLSVTSGTGKLEGNKKEFKLHEGYIFFAGHGVELKLGGKSQEELGRLDSSCRMKPWAL